MEADVTMKLRLDKYLADMGLGTRTGVKDLIKKGCISCNGEIVKKPEIKVDTEQDRVFYNGQEIQYNTMEYYIMNKPAGVLTATEDKKQKTVLDLLESSVRKDVFPVGRLDKDTEGLLLITNDGNLAHRLLSPKKHIAKRYFAIVSGIMEAQDIQAFANGLIVPEYRREGELIAQETSTVLQEQRFKNNSDRFAAFQAMPAEMKVLFLDREKNISHVEIQVYEGKFHQIKRMCQAVGKPVNYLKRISMGNLELDVSLKPGEYRKLTEEEVRYVKE